MGSRHLLRHYIESKRTEMIKTAKLYGFCAEVTIKCSQELDELLNQYCKLLVNEQSQKNAESFGYK